jgi:hypothetical protein
MASGRSVPLQLALVPRSKPLKLLEMEAISYLQIRIEELRKSNLFGQFHRCQTFGHAVVPQCVNYGEGHFDHGEYPNMWLACCMCE